VTWRGTVIIVLTLLFPLTNSIFFYIQLTCTEYESEGASLDQQNLVVEKVKHYLSSGFYENIGQIQNDDVLFYGSFSWGIIGFQQDSIRLQLDSENDVIILSFEGSNSVVPIGANKINQKTTHIKTNGRPVTGINRFSSIVYENLWHGIELVYIGTETGLKYEAHIQPGANPGIIRINSSGQDNLEINSTSILIRKGTMELVDEGLFAYQGEEIVDVEFRETGSDSFGFSVGHYDTSKELVIDPLIYSTLIGGSDFDEAYSVAVDANYYAYITGWTKSTNFPLANAFDTSFNGGDGNPGGDCFVLKLSPDGQSVVYSTFIGGARDDIGTSIAVDNAGNAYVTGQTKSIDFPIVNAYSSKYSGGQGDCFVFKLGTDGENLIYSSYVGGTGEDYSECIQIDNIGNAFVTGWTFSDDFPTVGAFDDSYDGTINFNSDCFVFKLSMNGDSLVYSTYIGGAGYEKGFSIAIDLVGNAYVTGYSDSPNFPKVNSFNDEYTGWDNCFLLKLNVSGNALIFSTQLTSHSTTVGKSIAMDSEHNVYVTGYLFDYVDSTGFTKADARHTVDYGEKVCIIFKVNSTGNGLLYYFLLGGSIHDEGTSIVIDAENNAYVTGFTKSPDFPTVNPFDESLGPPQDCFLSVLNAEGDNLTYSTFIGGSQWDSGSTLAIDNLGCVYIAGRPSLGFPTKNAYDTSSNGILDCFVLKIFVGTDSDADGIGDVYEPSFGTNPLKNDTDDDEIGDYEEIFVYFTDPCSNDTDIDGMPDGWEIRYGLNATTIDGDEDRDTDGLSNLEEYLYGTDPTNSDTDKDGFPDGWEIVNEYDPRDPSSPSNKEIVQDYGIWFVGIIVIGSMPPVMYYLKRKKPSIATGPGVNP
jgi:hypothetical protein